MIRVVANSKKLPDDETPLGKKKKGDKKDAKQPDIGKILLRSTRRAFELNAAMVRIAPELSSEYAEYPMLRERWLGPQETGPKGEPCFIAANEDEGPKPDYVYCKRGMSGPGYYSLLTKTAYVNLYGRIVAEGPAFACGCLSSRQARQQAADLEDVKRIIYNRSVKNVPNDLVGDEPDDRKITPILEEGDEVDVAGTD